MTALAWLVPSALLLGLIGLFAFMWSLRTGQLEDLEGAAWRALDDDAALEPQREARQRSPHRATKRETSS